MTNRLSPPFEDELASVTARFGVPAATEPLRRVLEFQATDVRASTTVTDPRGAVDRHVADSLVALELDGVRSATRIADIGSGAGWPGLALAAALPAAQVTLLDGALRRCRYLEAAVKTAELGNVEVVHSRAEEWRDGIEHHDLVTARALAAMPVVCEYAAPLLMTAGFLVAWKTTLAGDEAAAERAAAAELGLDLVEVRRVHPFDAARDRTLRVLRKVAPTPSRFPRRPGMAVKRPLGGG